MIDLENGKWYKVTFKGSGRTMVAKLRNRDTFDFEDFNIKPKVIVGLPAASGVIFTEPIEDIVEATIEEVALVCASGDNYILS